MVRSASCYGHWVQRTLYKLSLRGQGRSPLKYKNCRLCIWKEKFIHLRKIWISTNIVDKFSSIRQTFGAKTSKKCCHVGVLEAIVHLPFASSVQAEQTNFCSPPIKSLESFVYLTHGCSVKCSLDSSMLSPIFHYKI
jgi:hypothetical protein